MKRFRKSRLGCVAGAIMAASLAGPIGARAALPAKLDPDVLKPGGSGRAIVGFRHDVDRSTISRLSRAGITHAVVLDTIDAVGVVGPESAYRAVATWDDVAFVDDDSPIRFQNYGAKKDTRVTTTRAGTRPLRKRYNGANVTVAVVDTGVDSTHPDLEDRVVKHVNFEPSWFFDMIHDGLYSDQLSEATGNPIDSYGHGTHVAGIVAGTGAGAQGAEDFSGVAPGASIVNIKIADAWEGVTCDIPCDLGWEINALVGYEWLIENRNDPAFPGGIRIATNSWSIYEVDSEVEPITLIVQAAYRKGIVNVFAAGNAGPGDNTVALGPNAIEESITVGAVCKSNGYTDTDTCARGAIADFSSRGRQVDVVAPGVGIYSTMARPSAYGPIGGHNPPPGNDSAEGINNALLYTSLSGTSMATPHVAGVVALMLQANPKLKPADVEQILIRTVKDKGARGFDRTYGFGLVDAYKATVAAEAKGARRPVTRRR